MSENNDIQHHTRAGKQESPRVEAWLYQTGPSAMIMAASVQPGGYDPMEMNGGRIA
jgi:hypothetical protein